MQILYTNENVAEVLNVSLKIIKRWTRLGILPSIDCSPVRYLPEEIEKWIADGKLDLHKPKPK